jgi:hypothetical protein
MGGFVEIREENTEQVQEGENDREEALVRDWMRRISLLVLEIWNDFCMIMKDSDK